MTKIFCLIVALMSVFPVAAQQQDRYVFVQQPAGQPFYVRIGEDSYSSTAGGHLILAPLKDSSYEMYVGFARSRYPEQLFRIDVDKKDRGFELKQFDGSWQLFDLQSKQLVRAVGRSVQKLAGVKRTDTYSELMAGVVDDTTVLYIDSTAYRDTAAVAKIDSQNVVAKKAKDTASKAAAVVARKDSAKQEVKVAAVTKAPDSAAAKAPVVVADTLNNAISKKEKPDERAPEPIRDSVKVSDTTTAASAPVSRDPRDIIRLRTENIAEGKLMIFIDRTGPVNDTIRIIVPGR